MQLLSASRNKAMIRIIVIILFLGMAVAALGPIAPEQRAHAAGTTYYVGGSGASDSNPGTTSQPFATIQKAATVATAGDTVKIRSGTYRETITPTNSGTAGNPIVYEPDGAADVTVSGADTADGGWTVHSGNIYKKTITLPVDGYNDHATDNTTLMANQVFVNGEMMIEARWPNISGPEDLLDRSKMRAGSNGTWSGSITLNDPGIPQIAGGWVGGQAFINGWYQSQTGPITAQSGTQITFSAGLHPDFHDWYYLTGKLGALDVEKEWFYGSGTLYLRAPGSGSPTNVEVKKRNYAFELSGKSYITVKGLKIFAATINSSSSSESIIIDGIKAKYITHYVTLPPDVPTWPYVQAGNSHIYEGGIMLLGPNNVIQNSEIQYSSGNGVLILGAGALVHNNLIHDISYGGRFDSAIYMARNNADQTVGVPQTVTYNTVYRTGRSAIHDIFMDKDIGYNDFSEYGLLSTDGGAIYTDHIYLGAPDYVGVFSGGTRIHHNWFHDAAPTHEIDDRIGPGIYFDQRSGGGAVVDHNVVWNSYYLDSYTEMNDGIPLSIDRTVPIKWYNNTFGSPEDTVTYRQYSFLTYTDPAITILDDFKNNIYNSNYHRGAYVLGGNENYTTGDNSLKKTDNPLFVNEGAFDFQLQSGSPGRDTGVVLSGITDGYVGSLPDKGAYEYGETAWVPGYVAPGGPSPVPAPLPPAYQAENAVLSGGAAVNTNHTGYTGAAFVDSYGSVGATTTFTVHVPSAGDYDVDLRYANAQTTSRTLSVYVNGTKIKQTTLPNLANWDTWGVKTEELTLLAGYNTIAYKYDSGDTAAVNLDKITVTSGTSTPPPGPTKYEAENAAFAGNIATATNHTGYSGTSFVANYWGPGDATTFTVNAASAGNKDVTLRYANATGSPKTISIYVNGTKIKQTTLPNLANWDTWGDKIETLSLNAGSNTIAYRFDSGDSGIVNIDYILVSDGGGPTPITVSFQQGVNSYTGSADTHIQEYITNRNTGGNNELEVGRYLGGTATDDKSALIKFDLSSIPSSATITSATIELTLTNTRNGTPTKSFGVHKVTKAWGEGTKTGIDGATATTGEATWSYSAYSTAWTAAGGDYTATPTDTQAVAANIGGKYSWDIASMVQEWVANAATNQGMIFVEVSPQSTVNGTKDFGSKEHATAASRPKLTVTYTN